VGGIACSGRLGRSHVDLVDLVDLADLVDTVVWLAAS
jgi:hypothetical protein